MNKYVYMDIFIKSSFLKHDPPNFALPLQPRFGLALKAFWKRALNIFIVTPNSTVFFLFYISIVSRAPVSV